MAVGVRVAVGAGDALAATGVAAAWVADGVGVSAGAVPVVASAVGADEVVVVAVAVAVASAACWVGSSVAIGVVAAESESEPQFSVNASRTTPPARRCTLRCRARKNMRRILTSPPELWCQSGIGDGGQPTYCASQAGRLNGLAARVRRTRREFALVRLPSRPCFSRSLTTLIPWKILG